MLFLRLPWPYPGTASQLLHVEVMMCLCCHFQSVSNKAECVDVVTTFSAWLRQSWLCWCCHFQTQSMTLTKLNVLMLTMLMLSLSEHDFNKADCVDVECVDVVTFRLWAWLQQSWRCWCCHFQSKKPGTIKNKPKIVKGKKPSGGASKKSTKWWPHQLSPWLSCLR